MFNHHAISVLALAGVVSLCCQAMEDSPGKSRGVALMQAMKVEAGSDLKDNTHDLKDGDKIGAYTFKAHEPEQIEELQKTAFDLVDEQGKVIFIGYYVRANTPREARRALFEHLAMSTMMMKDLTRTLEVRKDGWGDLCIAKKVYDAQEKAFVALSYASHFVKGSAAISIEAVDHKTSVVDVARSIVVALGNDSGSK